MSHRTSRGDEIMPWQHGARLGADPGGPAPTPAHSPIAKRSGGSSASPAPSWPRADPARTFYQVFLNSRTVGKLRWVCLQHVNSRRGGGAGRRGAGGGAAGGRGGGGGRGDG